MSRRSSMRDWALIAQILGGLGQGIAGIKKDRQDRADKEEDRKRRDMYDRLAMQDREESKRRFEIERTDRTADREENKRRWEEQQDWREEDQKERRRTRAEDRLVALLRQRQEAAATAQREERLGKLSESEIELNRARAAAEGRPSARSSNARSDAARVAMRQRGIDPDAPDARSKLEEAIAALQKSQAAAGESLKGKSFADEGYDYELDQFKNNRKTLDSLMLGLDQLQPTAPGVSGVGGPQQPGPSMTAVDQRSHNDFLGAFGQLIGGVQGGGNLFDPIFGPMWNTMQKALGIQPPMGVQLQQQGMGPMGAR